MQWKWVPGIRNNRKYWDVINDPTILLKAWNAFHHSKDPKRRSPTDVYSCLSSSTPEEMQGCFEPTAELAK